MVILKKRLSTLYDHFYRYKRSSCEDQMINGPGRDMQERTVEMTRGGRAVWSPEQIEQWRLRQRAYVSDAASVMLHQDLDQRRWSVQQEMTQLLHSFLREEIGVKT